MKPLKVLVVLGMTLMSEMSMAHSFYIKAKNTSSTLGYELFSLWSKPSSTESPHIELSFIGTSGPVTDESWRIILVDHDDAYLVENLPITLEQETCKIKIKTENKIVELPWGKCKPVAFKPQNRFLPDLKIHESSNSNQVVIHNVGQDIISRDLKILAYLQNENGAVIWSEKKSIHLSLTSNEISKPLLHTQLENWQYHLGCSRKPTSKKWCIQ